MEHAVAVLVVWGLAFFLLWADEKLESRDLRRRLRDSEDNLCVARNHVSYCENRLNELDQQITERLTPSEEVRA